MRTEWVPFCGMVHEGCRRLREPMGSSEEPDAYVRAPAPHDLTIPRFANRGPQDELAGAEKNVGRRELCPDIRTVEDLAAHTAMTVIEDDEGLF